MEDELNSMPLMAAGTMLLNSEDDLQHSHAHSHAHAHSHSQTSTHHHDNHQENGNVGFSSSSSSTSTSNSTSNSPTLNLTSLHRGSSSRQNSLHSTPDLLLHPLSSTVSTSTVSPNLLMPRTSASLSPPSPPPLPLATPTASTTSSATAPSSSSSCSETTGPPPPPLLSSSEQTLPSSPSSSEPSEHSSSLAESPPPPLFSLPSKKNGSSSQRRYSWDRRWFSSSLANPSSTPTTSTFTDPSSPSFTTDFSKVTFTTSTTSSSSSSSSSSPPSSPSSSFSSSKSSHRFFPTKKSNGVSKSLDLKSVPETHPLFFSPTSSTTLASSSNLKRSGHLFTFLKTSTSTPSSSLTLDGSSSSSSSSTTAFSSASEKYLKHSPLATPHAPPPPPPPPPSITFNGPSSLTTWDNVVGGFEGKGTNKMLNKMKLKRACHKWASPNTSFSFRNASGESSSTMSPRLNLPSTSIEKSFRASSRPSSSPPSTLLASSSNSDHGVEKEVFDWMVEYSDDEKKQQQQQQHHPHHRTPSSSDPTPPSSSVVGQATVPASSASKVTKSWTWATLPFWTRQCLWMMTGFVVGGIPGCVGWILALPLEDARQWDALFLNPFTTWTFFSWATLAGYYVLQGLQFCLLVVAHRWKSLKGVTMVFHIEQLTPWINVLFGTSSALVADLTLVHPRWCVSDTDCAGWWLKSTLTASTITAVLILLEKVILQRIAVEFHQRTYVDRIALSKFNEQMLQLLSNAKSKVKKKNLTTPSSNPSSDKKASWPLLVSSKDMDPHLQKVGLLPPSTSNTPPSPPTLPPPNLSLFKPPI
ncbi:hypothetical protein HMI54_006112 [Coelomomyces lativittatus]|nr:hypothetical protein HMI54_006112 [Coelomomyces lativittatus]